MQTLSIKINDIQEYLKFYKDIYYIKKIIFPMLKTIDKQN